MWDPIASASAFYPKPGDESASSRKFPCFVRISSFFFFYHTLARHASTPLHGMPAVGHSQSSATKQSPALEIGDSSRILCVLAV